MSDATSGRRRLCVRPRAEALEDRTLLAADFPDFNNDGFDDLAIGVPLEDVLFQNRLIEDAGLVNVLYGSPAGLTAANNEYWTQASLDVRDEPEEGDQFGAALAWGDFNGDGFDDLAIGAPFDTPDIPKTVFQAGTVTILYGSAQGLTARGFDNRREFVDGTPLARIEYWHQDVSGVLEIAEAGDQFGAALTAGDFNGDGADDLAIGIPLESLEIGTSVISQAGAVAVLYGQVGFGLTAFRNQFIHQDFQTVMDKAEPGDQFGTSLASGDFNDDARDDLAIGVPYEDIGIGRTAKGDAGVVNVLYGRSATLGLTSQGNQLWYQSYNGVQDRPETGDFFGYALATGDFDGNGRDDLAIGVPYEDVPTGPVDAGAVNVLYGFGTSGLSGNNDDFWYQDRLFIQDELPEDRSERNDRFGWSLAVGDFDGNGEDDLAIGVPYEDVQLGSGIAVDAGAFNIMFGFAGTGLSPAGAQFFHQDVIMDGVPIEDDSVSARKAEFMDLFGFALATGNFDGDLRDDLAVGIPLEDIFTSRGFFTDAGAVNVFYGFDGLGLHTIDNQFWHQDVLPHPFAWDRVDSGDNFGRRLHGGRART